VPGDAAPELYQREKPVQRNAAKDEMRARERAVAGSRVVGRKSGKIHLPFILHGMAPGVEYSAPSLTCTELSSCCIAVMAAETSTSPLDPVKQFSVFTENRVGRLHDLTALFRQGNVHVMAITVLDTTDSAIVRLVVDDPDRARELMINNDFPYVESDVLALELADESELKGVLAALVEAEINLHYIYSFIKRPQLKGGLVINVEDADVASQALSQRGFKILNQGDISR
jgi:hypothetical protein